MNLDDLIQHAKNQNLDIHITTENGETQVRLDMGNGVMITRDLLPNGKLNLDQEDFKRLYGDLEQKGDPATEKVKHQLSTQGETLIKELELEEDSVILQTLKEITKEKGADPENIRVWLSRAGLFVTDQEGNSIEEGPVGEPLDDFTVSTPGGKEEPEEEGWTLDPYAQFVVDRRSDNNAKVDYVKTFKSMVSNCLTEEEKDVFVVNIMTAVENMDISEEEFKETVEDYLGYLLNYLFDGDTSIYDAIENDLKEIKGMSQEEIEAFMENLHKDVEYIRESLAKDMVLMEAAENIYKGEELLTDEEAEKAEKVRRDDFKHSEDTVVVYYGNRAVLDLAKAIMLCGFATVPTTKDHPLNLMLAIGEMDRKLGEAVDAIAKDVIYFLAGDFNETREIDLDKYFKAAFPTVRDEYEKEEKALAETFEKSDQKGVRSEPTKEPSEAEVVESGKEFSYELLEDEAKDILDKILEQDLSFTPYEGESATMEELENFIEDSVNELKKKNNSVYDRLLNAYNTDSLEAGEVVDVRNYLSFIENLLFYHKIGPKVQFCDRNLRVHMNSIDKDVEAIQESLKEQGITSLNDWVESEHIADQNFYNNVRYWEDYEDDPEAMARIFLASTNSTGETFESILGLLEKQKELDEKAKSAEKEEPKSFQDQLSILAGETLEEEKEQENSVTSYPEVEEDYPYPSVEDDYDKAQEDTAQATEQVIAEAYKQGAGVTYLQEKYHISAGTLQAILLRQGVKRHTKTTVENRVKHITEDPAKLNQLIKDYKSGKTLAYLYVKYDLYKNGLYYLLDSNNVPRRQR